MNRINKWKSQKKETSSVMNAFKALLRILSKRYMWTGLVLGFIWSFSTPFILTAFKESLRQFPQEAINILFFPLMLTFQMLILISGPENIDWLLLWGLSIIIGIITGVIITYSIHIINISIRAKRMRAAADRST